MGSENPPVDNAQLLEFHIEKTREGLVVSARIDPSLGDSKALVQEILAQIETLSLQVESLHTGDGTKPYNRRLVMNRKLEDVSRNCDNAAEAQASAKHEVIEWDDLIPEPPTRPSGRISVRLRKSERDEPLPAESPWAE